MKKMITSRLPRQTQTPIYRSVTFRHAESMPLGSPRGSLRRRSLSEGRSPLVKNNKVAPFLMLSNGQCTTITTTGRVTMTSAPEQQGHACEATDEHEALRNDSSHTWKWIVLSLDPVPKNYPLEQGTMEVENVAVKKVASRISDFTRAHSIACRFHKTSVDCTSPKLVRFVINLWKSPKHNTTLVELQRLQGSSLELSKIREDLFDTIQTGHVVDAPHPTEDHRVSLFLKQAHDEHYETTTEDVAAITDSWRIALELLQSRYLDQNRLGLESLLVLVNSAICGHDCAFRVSREVLVNPSLRLAVESYLLQKHSSNTDEDEQAYYSDSDVDEYAQHSHATDMHNLALQVWSRALEMVLLEERALPLSASNAVLESLVHDISMPHYFPQEAALSARILVLLSELNGSILTTHLKNALLPILWDAHGYGKRHHSQLETDTQALLERVGQS